MIEAYLHGAAIAAVKHLDKLLGWATGAFARRKLLQQEKIDNLFWDARGFPTITGRIVSSGLSGAPNIPVREYGLQSSLHGDTPLISTWVVLDIAAVADLEDALIRLFDSTSTFLEGHYGQFHSEVTVLLFKNGVLAPKQRRTLLRLLNQVMAIT